MFIVLYIFFNMLYMVVLILSIFFNRFLKFDKNFISLLLLGLTNLLNIFKDYLNWNNKSKSPYFKAKPTFKLLYSEYFFFSKNNPSVVNNLKKAILLTYSFSNFNFKGYNVKIMWLYTTLIILKGSAKGGINYNACVQKLNTNCILSQNYLSNTKFKYLTYMKKVNMIYLNPINTKIIVKFNKYLLLNLNNSIIRLNNGFYTLISSIWVIKYSPSNFIKYILQNKLNLYTILFLRKNKVFNKGRYSRNRQYYRTGVYWCLYVNIIAVVGIYFWFYRFTMNFGYLWWLLFIFITSFIIPKTIKFNLYNPKKLLNSLYKDILWVGSLIALFSNFIKGIVIFIGNYFKLMEYYNKGDYLKGIKFNFNASLIYNLFYFCTILSNIHNFNKIIYFWEFNNLNYYSNNNNYVFIKKTKEFLSQIIYFSFTI